MKKFLLILWLISLSNCYAQHFYNKITDTNFINGGYLKYDLNSYKYEFFKKAHIINVMEELDPSGNTKDIPCPYGEGYITHIITTTKYSPKNKTFVAEYKGFACSVGEYEYEGSKPISFDYNFKGIYYDNNTKLIPNFNMKYFEYLKTQINNPNEDYFNFIKNIHKFKE